MYIMSYEKKILVFTATYNEAENIYELISLIKTQSSNPHLLIIDDNSPDGTSDKVVTSQSKFKDVFLIKRSKKLGLDTAHKEAYSFAIKNNYDYLITMDADFSHDPNEINNFIKQLESHTFVIGSRYIKGGKCLMKGRRLVLSKYGNLFMRFFLKIDCYEFTTSYRGFNINKLKGFHLNQVKSNGYSFFMGTVFEIFKKDFDVKEIPIIFKDRKNGYSKIPRIEIFRTLFHLIKLKFKKI
jgi:dolichol-phosphate mannosyltransferase